MKLFRECLTRISALWGIPAGDHRYPHESIGISDNPEKRVKTAFLTVGTNGGDVGGGDGDDVGDGACGLGRPSCSH